MKRDHLTRLRQKVISYLASFLMVISLFPTNTVLAQEEEIKLMTSDIVSMAMRSHGPTGDGDLLENSLDGNPATYTNSNYNGENGLSGEELAQPQTYTFTLSEVMDISKVGVKARSADHLTQLDRFSVSLSEDNIKWNEVASGVDVTSADMIYATFEPTSAKYVKIDLYAEDGVNCVATSEVEIYRTESSEPEIVEPTAKIVVNGTSYDLPKDVTTGGNTVPEIEVIEGEEVKFVVSGKNLTKFSYMDPNSKTQRPSFTPGDTFECVLNDVQSGYYTFYITYEDSAGEEYTTSFDAKVLVQEESGPVTPDGFQGLIEIADNGIRQDGTTLYVTLEHQIDRLNAAIDGTSWTYDGDKTLTFTNVPESGAFFGNFSVFDQDGRITQHNIFREADGTWRVVVEYRSGVTYKDEVPRFYYGDGTADKQLVLDGSEEYTIYTTSGKPTIKVVGRHLESLQYYTMDVSGPTTTLYPEDDTDHTTLSATLNFEGAYRVIINDKVRTGSNKAISFKLNVVKGEEPEVVNKTELQALYDEVKNYVSDDTSYSKFETARDNAKAVLDKVDATQEEVDNAYNTLNQRYWLSKVDGMVKKYRPIESSSGNFDYELYVAESTLPIIRVYVEARNHTNTSYPAEELEKLYDQFVEAEKELESAGEKPRSVMVGPDVDQINTTSDRGTFAISEYQKEGKLYLHIEYTNDGINLIKGTDLGTISNYDLKNNARVNLIGYAYEEDGSLGGYSNTPITSKMEPLEGETDFAAGFQVNVEVQPGKYGVKLTLTDGKKEQANSYGYYYTSEPEVEVVDKAELQKAIDEAEKLEGIYYTEDSWNTLQTVLADAKKVYENTSADQNSVGQAVSSLKKAIEDLEYEGYAKIVEDGIKQDGANVTIKLDRKVTKSNVTTDWTYDGEYTLTNVNGKVPEEGEYYYDVIVLDLDGKTYHHVIYRDSENNWKVVFEGQKIPNPTYEVEYGGKTYTYPNDEDTGSLGDPIVIEGPVSEVVKVKITGYDLHSATLNVQGTSIPERVYEATGDRTVIEVPLLGRNDKLSTGTFYVMAKVTSASNMKAFAYFKIEEIGSLVDKSKLQTLYDDVKDYKSENGYFYYFETQLTNAKNTLDDPEATQETVDRQYNWLNAKYYALLVSELNAKYDPENVDLTKYTTESLIPVINMWGITHGKTVPNYQENEASDNVGQMQGWHEQYLEAEKGLKLADDTTEWIGIFDEAATKQETYQGHFEVVNEEVVNVDGEDKLQLTVRFINDGLHPIYGDKLGSKDFKKFGNLRDCSIRVEAYDADMDSKMSSGLQNITETEDGVEGTYIVDEGFEYLTFRITAKGEDDPSISAGYYRIPEMSVPFVTVVSVLEDDGKHVRLEINGPLSSNGNAITTPPESSFRDLNGFKYEFHEGKHTIVTDSYRQKDFDRVALISAVGKTTVNCLYYDENGKLQFYSYVKNEEDTDTDISLSGKVGANNYEIDVDGKGTSITDPYVVEKTFSGYPNEVILTITGTDLYAENDGSSSGNQRPLLCKYDEYARKLYEIEGTMSLDHRTITFVIKNPTTGAVESGVYATKPLLFFSFANNQNTSGTCFEINVQKLSNTLYYDTNGGEGGPSSNYTNGKNITIQSKTPTRDGYEFVGWNTKADGTGTTYQPSSSYPIDPNGIGGQKVTLYAMWQEIITLTPEENLTGYTGGDSLNRTSFPNMRYTISLPGDVDNR